ncbi:MAG: 2-hydroxyacid dehydrogenase [Candidatus Marinimicrobia bacterium]|nr:2-hydroxyacid dehydrogenase [Candidatus Neomarinimicrobiota bacterium]
MKKIAFFDTKPYDKRSFEEVNKAFNFKIKYFKTRLSNETVELTDGYDAVCAFVNDELDKYVLDHLKKNGVELIALRCAGYNNVDLKHAYKRVHVLRVPGYSPYSVAEHASALIAALNRKTHRAYYRTRDGNFSIEGLMGFDQHGKTAGIIGTGKIGQCLISILKGYGMRILAYDLFPNHEYAEKTGIEYTDFKTLYRESEVISLHCPLTPETHYLINDETIDMMKPGVILINTGRGQLINTLALIKGLKSGKIGGAGLDVYEEEAKYFFEDFSNSAISDDVLARLMTFPNVLITSHQGFFTKEALKSIAETTLQNIRDFFDDKILQNEICYNCSGNCVKPGKKRCF